jgi:hypothetical protein
MVVSSAKGPDDFLLKSSNQSNVSSGEIRSGISRFSKYVRIN